MRTFLTILFILPFSVQATLQGYLTVISLRMYVSRQVGTSSSGSPQYAASPQGPTYTVVRYTAGTQAPVYQINKDLNGNPAQQPPTSEYSVLLVTGYTHVPVDNSISGFNGSPFNDDYLSPRWMTPIYDSSSGLPFVQGEGNYYISPNDSFGLGGSLNILQGNLSYDPSSYANYLSYADDLSPVFSPLGMSLADGGGGYTFTYDPSTGQYIPVSVSSGNGSVDLSPVVDAVNNQGSSIVSADNSNQTALRNLLVNLLGSSGSSWVYDCKLSLAQLYSLASTQGLLSSIDSQTLSYIDSNLSTITPAVLDIANKDFSPTINVAAPNVTVNPAEVNIDTSKLATQKTLNDFYTRNHTDVNNVRNLLNNTMLPVINQIGTVLNSWNTGNEVPSTLPQPDFGEDQPNDILPSFAQGAWASNGALSDSSLGQVYGDLVSWGDNGSPTMIIPDFISGFLTAWVGQIPSVGSDPAMFSVDFDLPYIGRVQRDFSWADFPYVSDFRALLVWLCYVYFGLACFKLLHRTLI